MARRETRLEHLAYYGCFAVALAAACAALLLLWRRGGWEAVAELGGLAATSILLVGEFVVFAGLREEATFGPWEIAALIWGIDVILAFTVSSGLEGFERLPVVGGWLRKAHGRAGDVLDEYPRLRAMAFFGVATFVLLPLAATGAISGSFAARLVGLSRLGGVSAVALGSAGIVSTLALLATSLGEGAEDLVQDPWVTAATVAVAALLAWLAFRRVKAHLRG